MLKRTITAVVLVAVFIPIVIFSDTPLFPAVMAVLSVIAAYEMLSCIGLRTNIAVSIPAYIYAAALPLVPFFAREDSLAPVFAASVVYLVVILAVTVFSRGKLDVTLSLSAFAGIFYTAVSFSSIMLLRTEGKYLWLLVFIGPWLSDIFAYLVGRAIGKHKLIPEVSPKKTVEGSLGGIVFAAAGFVLYAFIVKRFFDPSLTPNYIVLAVSGAVVSVISQIGDLSASVIKRHFGIKDYGWLFPGHGGVLDRFDSVLLTAPIICMISLIPGLGNILI